MLVANQKTKAAIFGPIISQELNTTPLPSNIYSSNQNSTPPINSNSGTPNPVPPTTISGTLPTPNSNGCLSNYKYSTTTGKLCSDAPINMIMVPEYIDGYNTIDLLHYLAQLKAIQNSH